MQGVIISSLIIILLVGVVISIMTIIEVRKNPEKFKKQSDEMNEQISNMKTSFLGNISWEDAKRQAAEQLELEAKLKADKKAAKKNKQQTN